MLYFPCWCWQLCKSSEDKISFCSYSLSRKSEAVGGEKNLDRSGTAGTTQQPCFQEKCLLLRSESIQWVLKHIISPLAVLCSSASSYVSKSTHATLILCLPQSVCFSSNLMVSFFGHPCQCKEQVFHFRINFPSSTLPKGLHRHWRGNSLFSSRQKASPVPPDWIKQDIKRTCQIWCDQWGEVRAVPMQSKDLGCRYGRFKNRTNPVEIFPFKGKEDESRRLQAIPNVQAATVQEWGRAVWLTAPQQGTHCLNPDFWITVCKSSKTVYMLSLTCPHLSRQFNPA